MAWQHEDMSAAHERRNQAERLAMQPPTATLARCKKHPEHPNEGVHRCPVCEKEAAEAAQAARQEAECLEAAFAALPLLAESNVREVLVPRDNFDGADWMPVEEFLRRRPGLTFRLSTIGAKCSPAGWTFVVR